MATDHRNIIITDQDRITDPLLTGITDLQDIIMNQIIITGQDLTGILITENTEDITFRQDR